MDVAREGGDVVPVNVVDARLRRDGAITPQGIKRERRGLQPTLTECVLSHTGGCDHS